MRKPGHAGASFVFVIVADNDTEATMVGSCIATMEDGSRGAGYADTVVEEGPHRRFMNIPWTATTNTNMWTSLELS